MIMRMASIYDIDVLIKLRIDYLTMDRGFLSEDETQTIIKQLGGYFPKKLENGEFIAVFAEENDVVVSAAFLAMSEKPANPDFPTGKVATLLNVMTYPEYRRKGLATKVIQLIIDEATLKGVSSIDLMATNEGKPLYEKLGFQTPNYITMRLNIL